MKVTKKFRRTAEGGGREGGGCYRARRLQTNRPLTVAALLLAMFMSALEATVVATAMPTVVGDLGGLALYGWVGSAYLLASTVSVPIYGKLADLKGRKPVLVLGIVLFLLGSVASGAARTIWQLIGFRALQGAGAGAMQPVTLTILGDLYTPEERGRVQGLFGAVWGIAGVSGPLLGGLIVRWLGWRWVFFLNVPIGALGLLVLLWAYREERAAARGALDLPGALLIGASSVLLLVGASGGGWGALAVGALLLAAFVLVEGRVAAPLLPLGLITGRAMAVATGSSALFGVAMMGSLIYAPLLVQEVRGGTPTEAGAVVAPMLVGWPIAATATSKLLVRIGYRRPIQLGAAFVAAGSAGFAGAVMAGASAWVLQGCMFFFGIGMGLANTAILIAVQASVDWSQRGIVTALNMFARSMGGTLGVGALGGVLAASLGIQVGSERGTVALDAAQRAALEGALSTVFLAVAAVAVANALLALLYPESGPPGSSRAP